jgi:hypothetical protein
VELKLAQEASWFVAALVFTYQGTYAFIHLIISRGPEFKT